MASYGTLSYGDVFDAQFDDAGWRLACAYADGVVRVWGSEYKDLQGELRGHKEAACTLSWGHGRFASTLASASPDGHVIIWREAKPGSWQAVPQYNAPGGATTVAFCPHEFGLELAIAAGNGDVHLVTRREVKASPVLPAGEKWNCKWFHAHDGGGVASLSWAPSTSPAILATGQAASRAAQHAKRCLVTGGEDGSVRAWNYEEKLDCWTHGHDLNNPKHTGAIRAVAWRPNLGIPASVIATSTASGSVAIWMQDMAGQPWILQSCWNVGNDACRLNWSRAGLQLSVSVGSAGHKMFMEDKHSTGKWKEVIASAE